MADPELAQVGMSEQAAKARGLEVKALCWPFAENDRAQAERETAGLIKAVTDRERPHPRRDNRRRARRRADPAARLSGATHSRSPKR